MNNGAEGNEYTNIMANDGKYYGWCVRFCKFQINSQLKVVFAKQP